MKIGIVGAGRIGGTIATRLSAAGYDVWLSNSRGPDSLRELAAATGTTAASRKDVVSGADVVITSVPFPQIPSLRADLDHAPEGAVFIDTSNYFAFKDGGIPGLGQGQVETLWVSEKLNRSIVKAWNAILAGSFATKALPPNAPGRIALPVAGDEKSAKDLAMALVEITGFDAVDAGSIAESWRQQPGSPAYTTELNADDLRDALARADQATLGPKRDGMVARMMEIGHPAPNDVLLRLSREAYL